MNVPYKPPILFDALGAHLANMGGGDCQKMVSLMVIRLERTFWHAEV